MKKAAIAIIIVLAVIIGSILWIRSQFGITDPALLVPAETIALAALPDLPRTALRWPNTTLSKITGEQEIKDFLAKPVTQFGKQAGGEEAGQILLGLKPGRIFAAVLPGEGAQVKSVLGFQYWGSKGDFDRAISRLRQYLHQGQVPEPVKESHQGTEIISTTLNGGNAVFTTSVGRWGLVSNNREALVAVMDRAAGREASTLAADPGFVSATARSPKDADVMVFARPGPILDSALQVGQTLGARADENQIAQIRSAEALTYTLKLDGADLRETFFVLRQNPPEVGTLAHLGMPLTSPETLGYFDFLIQHEAIAGFLTDSPASQVIPPDVAGTAPLIERLPEAFHREASVFFSWPQDRMSPELLLASAVKDPAKAEALLLEASSRLPETTITDVNGIKFYSFPSLKSPFFDPTFAVTPEYFLFGLNPGDVTSALERGNNPNTLEKSPAFAPALESFRTANESFGYLDAKGIFTKAYPLLRQVIVFGAAIMPGASDLIDPDKVPQTDTIAKHLTPILYSQTRVQDGYLIESSGPITMNHAVLLGASIGSALLGPQFLPPQQ